MPTDVSSLLNMYRLRANQTKRLLARSDLHDGAHVRMHPEDVEALAHPTDSLRPMIALFSTASASEAVCLRTAETVYVMPSKKAEWVPLRVTASHAYVRGMRVSGTIHRAVLRLVRE
jgi:hypothetical protein